MNYKNYLLTLLLTLTLLLFGCADVEDPVQPIVENNEVEEAKKTGIASEEFMGAIIGQMPLEYQVINTPYTPRLSFDPVDATKIEPCGFDVVKGDPTVDPFCYTNLIFWTEEGRKESSVKDFLQAIDYFSDDDFVETKQKNGADLIYTEDYFMCPGTGGDGCLRRAFIYATAEEGKFVIAEMHYWPPYTNDGPDLKTVPDNIKKVLDQYEAVLMSI